MFRRRARAVNTCPSRLTITPLPCAGPTRTPTVERVISADSRCITACMAFSSSTVLGALPEKIAAGSRASLGASPLTLLWTRRFPAIVRRFGCRLARWRRLARRCFHGGRLHSRRRRPSLLRLKEWRRKSASGHDRELRKSHMQWRATRRCSSEIEGAATTLAPPSVVQAFLPAAIWQSPNCTTCGNPHGLPAVFITLVTSYRSAKTVCQPTAAKKSTAWAISIVPA